MVNIDAPHAEMRISPTHIYRFIKSAPNGNPRRNEIPPHRLQNREGQIFKDFVLNQDIIRVIMPHLPKANEEPGKLRIFTELRETGEEVSVKSRSAHGLLPVAMFRVPNLEGLEPVLHYCYRPRSFVIFKIVLGEHLLHFSKYYHDFIFWDINRKKRQYSWAVLKRLRVSRRIALSRPISDENFDQLLLSRIRLGESVKRVADHFCLTCPYFWGGLQGARNILYSAAVYRYQEAHKDKYIPWYPLESSPEAISDELSLPAGFFPRPCPRPRTP
jgi:hypothetical protein